MTQRLSTNHPYNAYHQGEPPTTVPQVSNEGLGTKKTALVLVVVVGCFAVLWPKLFYPMLVNNANSHSKPGPVDKTTGCCDVISELDVDTMKIMSELCSTLVDHRGKTPKEIVAQCRKAVLETCSIDISAALQDRISLGHSARQILEEVRSLNGSQCLKYNFGVSPWSLGVPHRIHLNLDPINNIRQERPSQMRKGMVHPAFKERGRAIPEADASAAVRRTVPHPKIVEGRPGPIPGMRPTLGGPGHVVPPPKQGNYGFMGVLMPIYTVGFIVFFSYTIMKLVCKKKPETYVGAPLYPPCDTDEQFHKEVFEANRHYFSRPNKDTSKVGDDELDQLRKRLRETELAMERIVHQMARAPLATQDEIRPNGSLPKEEDQGSVTVMGMETTASSESGRKWSRPDSPVLPHPHRVPPKEASPPPQQIFLEGALPPQSQILVAAESATETPRDLCSEDDSPVVLAGKMTLSVISLDSETGTDDSSNSGKKSETFGEEERRQSSSNASDDFEKINAEDLEDQINSIIDEAEHIALAEENRFSPDVEKLSEPQMPKTPQINEKETDCDFLEEIKKEFNLEDDLLQALKEREPEEKVCLPVTDIIKEFLSSEENMLLESSPDLRPSDDPMAAEQVEDLGNKAQEIVDEIQRQKDDRDMKVVESETLSEEDVDLEAEEANNLTGDFNLEGPTEEDRVEAHHVPFETTKSGFDDDEEDIDITSELNQLVENWEEPEETETNTLEKYRVRFDTSEVEAYEDQEDIDIASESNENSKQPEKIEKESDKLYNKAQVRFDTSEVEAYEDQEDIDIIASESNENSKQPEKLEQESDKLDNKDHVRFDTSESDEDHEDIDIASSEIEEHPEQKADPTNGKNMADLLLQGLMVKEDEAILKSTATDNVLSSDTFDSDDRTSALAESLSSDASKEKEPLLATATGQDAKEESDEEDAALERLGDTEDRRASDVVVDSEEQLIDDADYDDDSGDLDEDELREIYANYEDRESVERRLNGDDGDSSRNGAGISETAAENDISEDELENDEDDEEIEEIIEYVDNTDEEGEEIIEVNGNERRHAGNDAN